ncbi:WD domain, G-beta repeat-containing protein [Cardiosporidium cionae]|uniref:WD domain, G-beta repeat-containing protein n=1 Tax=Cardiosporidium cionae TaxID=476202 RepID=A0ABQ7J754_9APIC|nr:WD domain, G-beta repeat-containing protein [Cardiosporidium cionae]|eukprot:KAF8819825.1 WD domain, G-beta repeat-containing protein [Cardiosporidium cionae]
MLRCSYACDVTCGGLYGGRVIQWCPLSATFIALHENSLSFIRDDLCLQSNRGQALPSYVVPGHIFNAEQYLDPSFQPQTHPIFLPLGGGEDGLSSADSLLTFVASADATHLVTASRSCILRSWCITLPNSLTTKQNVLPYVPPGCSVAEVNNAPEMRQIACWKGPPSYVSALALQEPLSNVAAGAVDGTLIVYQINDGFCSNSFNLHTSRIGVLKFHPRIPSLLISGSDDGMLRVWNLNNSSCVAECNDHLSSIASIEFALLSSKDVSAGAFVSAGRDKIVNVWNLNALLHTTSSNNNDLDCATTGVYLPKRNEGDHFEKSDPICSESEIKLSEQDNTSVRLKNASSILHPIQQIVTNEGIESVVCFPSLFVLEEQLIASLEMENKDHEMDSKKRKMSHKSLKKRSNVPPWVILTAGESGYIRIWNPINKRMIKEIAGLHGSKGAITNLFRLGNQHVASVGIDCCIRFWSLPDFILRHSLLGRLDDVIHCQFIPKYEQEATTSMHSTALRMSKDVTFSDAFKAIPGISSERCALLCGDERAYIFQLRKPFSAWPLIGHTDVILCCDVSPSGEWILTGSKDQTVRLWRVDTHSCYAIMKGHCGPVTAATFQKQYKKVRKSVESSSSSNSFNKNSDPLFVSSAAQDLSLKVWQIPMLPPNVLVLEGESTSSCQTLEKSLHSVNAHSKEINAICVATKDRMLASAGQDKLIKVWTFPDLKLLGICKGHQRGVWSVQFSQIEKVIVSASADTTIKLWNLQDFTCLKTLQGHAAAVLQAIFLPGGVQVVSCSADGMIKLWNIRTSECAGTFEKHNEKVWSLDCNENHILSGGADGKVILWRDNSSAVEEAQMREKKDQAIQDTQIQQLMLKGRFAEALTLSLELNRPAQSRQLFESIARHRLLQRIDQKLHTSCREGDAMPHLKDTHPDTVLLSEDSLKTAISDDMYKKALEDTEISEWLASLSEKNRHRLFEFIVRWNSVSKHASLASSLMSILINLLRPEELYRIEGFPQFIASYLAYSSRHENRLQVLLQESFLLDLVLGGTSAACSSPLQGDPSTPALSDLSFGDVKRNRMSSHHFLLN